MAMNPNKCKTKIEKLLRKEGRKGKSASGDEDTNYINALSTYGCDLVEVARKVDPVTCRDLQIHFITNILSRQHKNNPLLAGQLHLWRTTLVEELAHRIACGNVPSNMLDVHIVALNMGALMAGAKYCSEFEDRVKAILKEVKEAKGKVILFINEIHLVLNADREAEGSMDAANLFKAMLARGELQCIGEMTDEECEKYVKKDATFEPLFQPVYLINEAFRTVVSFSKEVKENLVLNNEGGSVSHWTDHIPAVTRLQGQQNEKEIRLIGLAERLHERVVGQNEAVNTVAEAVLRSRVGLGWPQQPIGSFLFLGPAGVGKTKLAKALAEQLFDDDDDDLLIHIDMSEYMDQHSVAHLTGGMLTEAVRRRPYCVILFDQVEKAHVALFNTLHQVLDGGRLTDSQGRTVDFTNTVIIITSNLAAEYLLDGMVLQGQYSLLQIARERVMIEVRKHFSPELLNRLDEIVIFDPLSHDQLRKVARLQMMDIALSLADRDIALAITDAALDVVLSEPYDLVYNASSIRRSLAKKVLTHLSKMLVQGEIDENSIVYVDTVPGKKELSYKVEKNGSFANAETEKKSDILIGRDTSRPSSN